MTTSTAISTVTTIAIRASLLQAHCFGEFLVDGEQRLAGDDRLDVAVDDRLADDLVILRILELDVDPPWEASCWPACRSTGRSRGSGCWPCPTLCPKRWSASLPARSTAAPRPLTSIMRAIAPTCRIGTQFCGVAVLPPAIWPAYLVPPGSTSVCSMVTSFQSTSSSSAISIGSMVRMPWPTSGFLAMMVTLPSGVILM